MELHDFFQKRQNGELTREQEVLADELRLMTNTKSRVTLRHLGLFGLIKEDDEEEFLSSEFEIAAFYISWMEMIALNDLKLSEDRECELKITLLAARMTFCLNMKKKGIGGNKSAGYWMDRMVGRCRQYWARMKLDNPPSRAETCGLLLENILHSKKETHDIAEEIRRGIEENVMNLENMVVARLSRRGLKEMSFR